MNFILFDGSRIDFLPLTFTRPVAEIRIGILTIREKWEKRIGKKASYQTEDYLSKKFPVQFTAGEDNVWLNGSVCPNEKLVEEVKKLKKNEALHAGEILLAANSGVEKNFRKLPFKKIPSSAAALKLNHVWEIFSKNGEELQCDFDLITKERNSYPLSKTNRLINRENIFIEEGAKAEYSILNAAAGPVYIGKDAEVMEGSMIRGPFAIGEHSTLKLGAKIYGPTTIGPYCKVGGEVNNSVIFGYSSKAHDGFLGNSVIAEWCNIGADSNNSNLKNNYAEVKLWDYEKEKFVGTGLTFCGLIMADHSKCAINTMFNTGTVVGVNANIFGAGFPRNFIPDFSWGGANGFTVYKLKEAFETAERVMNRRAHALGETEKEILTKVFELTRKYRKQS